MAIAPSPHRLTNIDIRDRRADCAKCGPVKIKSAGSNGRGGTRWRCSAQVKQARHEQRQQQRDQRQRQERDARQRLALDLVLPCCSTIDHLPPPTDRDEQGDWVEEYYSKCPACGQVTLERVTISQDHDDLMGKGPNAIVAMVEFIAATQFYVNGRLDGDGTVTATAMFNVDRAGQDELEPATTA